MSTSLPHSPDGIGIAAVDVARTEAGWTVAIAVPGDLHGPSGILQGGLSSSLPRIAAQVLLDEHGVVPGLTSRDITTVHARLRRPTPVGALVHAVVHVEDLTDLHVEVRNGDEVVVRGVVDVSGPPPVPLIGDLAELATGPAGTTHHQTEYPDCFVCGSGNARGLKILPHPFGRTGRSSAPWVADERVDDGTGHVHPVAISAVLDCPGVWAGVLQAGPEAGFALLADYRVQTFATAPLGARTRTVGLVDDLNERSVTVRTGFHDDAGRLLALATGTHVWAPAMPPGPTPATAL